MMLCHDLLKRKVSCVMFSSLHNFLPKSFKAATQSLEKVLKFDGGWLRAVDCAQVGDEVRMLNHQFS